MTLDMLFANIDDPQETMDSISNAIQSPHGDFAKITNWRDFEDKLAEYARPGRPGEISVASWKKYKRIVSTALSNPIFVNSINPSYRDIRLRDAIGKLKNNDVYVIDIARLGETMQSFVFGDVVKAVNDLKSDQIENIDEGEIPNRIIIFIDELNKYASSDVPKNSPILRQLLDIAERGRTQGIILFSAEQFKSAIHDRIKGNCSTHAYGRTNAVEISKGDYKFIPNVYKNLMTRLQQGEYIVQNPIFRSLLSIKFPKPLYKQFK